MTKNSPGPPVNTGAVAADPSGLSLQQQVLLEQKQAFVDHCRKLITVSNLKYEAL